MARKLQSDKWLFLATLALVCISVVMVYSASAVIADASADGAYAYVRKQAMWAVLGVAVLSIVMRVDYRTYRNEQLIWALLGVVGVLLAPRAVRARLPDGLGLTLALTLGLLDLAALVKFVAPAFPLR